MLKLASIFQNGMVLQRQKPVSIWGHSEAGVRITVRIQKQEHKTAAGSDGAWRITLSPLKTSSRETLTVTNETETIDLYDVAVGEVWIGGGQSNMEFFMAYERSYDKEAERCSSPDIRFYDVPEITDEAQLTRFDYSRVGIWRKATPKDLAWFSAVGYYFSRDLYEKMKVPIAVIGCNWGGTSIISWLNLENPQTDRMPLMDTSQLKLSRKDIEKLWKDRGNLLDDAFTDFIMKKTVTYDEVNEFWGEAAKEFWRTSSDIKQESIPGILYDHMVKPIGGYSVRGILWYQGESDDTDERRDIYDCLLAQMIYDWRALWEESGLPFLLVQLPALENWIGFENIGYHVIREKQKLVSEHVPGVWLCSISDAGEQYEIHPRNKKIVGERLALLAMGHVYGKNILCDAPEAKTACRRGKQIMIQFHHTGRGLYIRGGKLNALKITCDGRELSYTASAAGSELMIKLTEPAEKQVMAAFAQDKWYRVNLYNSSDLPAVPFVFTV